MGDEEQMDAKAVLQLIAARVSLQRKKLEAALDCGDHAPDQWEDEKVCGRLNSETVKLVEEILSDCGWNRD